VSAGVWPDRLRKVAWNSMRKVLRTVCGLVIVGLVLHAADLATRDCRIAPYVYDDCMWVEIRTHLGLPASRLLRMAVMECVGIALALVLYYTIRYVFPFRKPTSASPTLPSDPPTKNS
jgi:hypothetical protein